MSDTGPTSGFQIGAGWRILLQDLGLDTRRILKRAGLPADLFARGRTTLPTAEFVRLWDAIDVEADEPLLPLRVGKAISTEIFDPPIFAAMCSPDMTVAFRRIARFKRLMCPLRLHVDAGPDGTAVSFEWLDPLHPMPRSYLITDLLFFVQIVRIATRVPVRPLQISMPDPPREPEYAEWIGSPITAGETGRVMFSAIDAARPFLTANDQMWDFFEPELRRRLSEIDAAASTSDRVRAALLELLPSGQGAVDQVARRLGTSPRTLQRRLRTEQQSFRKVLDATREELARHYLGRSEMSGAEISYLLGFDDPNSFFRAFRTWTGTTPEQARATMAG